jgi:NADH dehydrogenase
MNPATGRAAGETGTNRVTSADIVILGAGYGGLHVAQRLMSLLDGERRADGSPWSLLIVDRQSHHQLTTELPRIVGNEVADSDLVIPLDQLLSEHEDQFLQAEIQAIRPGPDSQPGWVETSAGRIDYHCLVIALGSVSNDFGIPGVHEYMRRFLTTEDARGLRMAAARAIQDAARVEFDQPDCDLHELRRRLTVLIGGAGPTGVEVAGELAEFMEGQWRAAWQVAGEPENYRLPKPHVILVDAAPTVLPGWSDQTSQAVMDALRELGVEPRLAAPITRVEPGRVQIKGEEWIAAGTLVWTGGVRAPKLLQEAGLPTGSSGRIIVDRFQRIAERPNIFAVGDSALLLDKRTGKPVPPTADIALRSGETAALALAATIQGRKPERVLRPLTRNAVSVGRYAGAANLLGITIKGKPARAIKSLIEWEYRQSITRLHGYSAATVV